ncbi:MAG: spore coat associated protein CotJA [Firmicutes bacterium]|nr:spore coat associated protein CotJA [Bacillota bacterium]
MRLARAYVPFQIFNKRLNPMEGLMKGTIFPELYFPYRGHKR